MKSKKSLLLIFVLALVATACSTAATPCDEAEITTGENERPGPNGGLHMQKNQNKIKYVSTN